VAFVAQFTHSEIVSVEMSSVVHGINAYCIVTRMQSAAAVVAKQLRLSLGSLQE